VIGAALILAAVGLATSALFSGSETGFYRATRLRLVLDAMAGSPTARGLVWMANHPSLFVATVLVGTNLANYFVSLAVVALTQLLSPQSGHVAELVASLIVAPVLFIYGELVPKKFFLEAPNRLLQRAGPLMLCCAVLFFPVSMLVWAFDWLLRKLVRQSSEQVRTTLARRELRRVLEEGHEAGILHQTQRTLAQGIFAIAGEPVGRLLTPLTHLPRARATMSREEVLRLASRYRIAAVPVEAADDSRQLLGYVRVIDLAIQADEALGPLLPLEKIGERTNHLAALMRMQSAKEELAAVVDDQGRTLGVVSVDQLREPLFFAPK
jgi:CBS domain containing-hemolysin-like protein